MRLFIVCVVILIAFSASAVNKQQNQPQEQHSVNQSPPNSPVTVIVNQPSSPTQKEVSQAKTHTQYEWFWPPIWSNWGLVIVAVIAARAALKTLGAIDAQVVEMRKTGEQTDKLIKENIAHSMSMEHFVKEATRLASAMEAVVKEIAISAKASTESVATLKDRTARQMRAYLTVTIGGAVYQERAKNLKFEGKPNLINTGHTPAHKVVHRCKAAILPVPLPTDFAFPLPDQDAGTYVVGPQQTAVLNAIVDDFCDDAEVQDIKIAKGRGLYTWGIINYEDVFGEAHVTRFCQMLIWLPDEKIWGYYIPGRNDAT